MLDGLERRDLEIDGVTAHVWVSGDEAGPTFVLVHGLGVSSRYFGPLAHLLLPLGRVVLFDLPGFGRTPEPQRPLGIEGFATVVAEAARRLGVEDAAWLGHSMGAQIVVEVAARHPELARGVLLASPVVTHGARSVRRQAWAFLRSAVHERLSAALVSVQSYLAGGLAWPREVLPAMMQYPIERRLAGLGQHVVLVRGSYDAVSPGSWLRELAAAASGAASVEIVEVPGAAHQLVVRDADLVAEALVGLAERGA